MARLDSPQDLVQQFWANQEKSACPDDIARDMSIATISRYLPEGAIGLDIGCGNGFCTFQFAETPIKHITGLDFSAGMIRNALEARGYYSADIQAKTNFEVGDATNLLFPEENFDVAISIRCLINVTDPQLQVKVIREIGRILRPGGLYFMCENTQQGLNLLNEWRAIVDLPPITTRWHNLYLDENLIESTINELFETRTVDHFASLYYLASRVFNAKLATLEGKEPSYDAPINRIASKLPSIGEFSPMRLYVLEKR